MFPYKYVIRQDVVADEEGTEYTVWGVDLFENGALLESVPDVFFEREKAEYYIGLFNELELDPIHLYDVIEDILG